VSAVTEVASSNGACVPATATLLAWILSAATEVFAERGFHGASVEDICERAGFTRGAFYSNFGALDDLVTEPYEQHARRLSARVETLSSRSDLAPEQILAAVLDVWSESPTAEAQWYLLQIEFTLHAIRDKAAGRAWARQQSKVRADLVTLVERVVARHGMTLSVTPEEFVRLAQAIYQGGMSQHLLQPRSIRRGGLERRFLPLVFEAVTVARDKPGQPPATDGRIWITASGPTRRSSPPRRRTSSPSTNTLTCLRSAPVSSRIRAPSCGRVTTAASRIVRRSADSPPTGTTSSPRPSASSRRTPGRMIRTPSLT